VPGAADRQARRFQFQARASGASRNRTRHRSDRGDPKWRRLDTLDAAPFIIAMLRFSCQPTGLLKRGTASGERATRLARSDDPAGFVVRRRPFVAMARLHGT